MKQGSFPEIKQTIPHSKLQNIDRLHKKDRCSILLFLSSIIGIAYSVFIVNYFMGVGNQSMASGSDIGRQIGGLIAVTFVTPHVVLVSLAAVANGIAWYINNGWVALTSSVLYLIAGLIFIIYLPFIILPMILSFIGFMRVNYKKSKKKLA